MKKRTIIVSVVLVLCMLLSSCGGSDKSITGEEIFGEISFIDSTGYQVVLKDYPQRVAILFSSYVEIWSLAGGETAITVGDSVSRGFVEESKVSLVDDGSGIEINQELLVSLKPDFVIGSADMEAQVKACEFCRSVGIPSALFRVDELNDYLLMLNYFTTITGNEEAYVKYGSRISDEINSIRHATADYTKDKEPTNILFVRAGSAARSTKAKTADDHFAARMLKELGTYNIAENAEVLLDGLSLEEIVSEDPEYIFISTQGNENAAKQYIEELFAGDGWKELSAVKNSKYIFLPKDMFHYKPNQRWAEAYRYLVEILYPELELELE